MTINNLVIANGPNARIARARGVFGKLTARDTTPIRVSPIPYLKVVRDEAFTAYNLGQHFWGWHSIAIAPGSPALPAGMTLNSAGVLSGTATVAGMNQTPVIRVTNAVSGLSSDHALLVSVAQRPGDLPAPALTELTSTSFRITKPTLPANTPAITSIDILRGPTLPLSAATGTQVFNAYPGGNTTFDVTVSQAGSTRHVALRAKVLWGDGTTLNALSFSPNVASITLSGANTAPAYQTQPSISPASGPVGTVFSFIGGTVSGQPTPTNTLIGLTQNGIDVFAQVSNGQFTSTEAGPLIATWQAVNGVLPNATAQASAAVTTVAQVPGQMAAPTLSVVSASQIDATLAAAPADGGATITSYEMRYSLDQQNWTVLAGLVAGETRALLGLLASTVYYVQTAARNVVGLGPWSPSRMAMTNAASGTTLAFGQYTAIGAGAAAISEADGDYGQFTVASGVATPNASPLSVGVHTIGSTSISVVANEYSVASLAEFTAARTAMGSAGGRTIRFRAGTYSVGTDYVLASTLYSSLVTITGEPGAKIAGNVFLTNPSNLLVSGLEFDCTDTTRFAIIRLSGACSGVRIEDNYIHGVTRNPLGDYSAGGAYQNPEKGIGCASGTQLDGCCIKRNRIEHVQEGVVLLIGGASPYDVWDNDIGYTYSDAFKIAIYAAGALTAPKRWRRNWWYMMLGRQDDASGNGPHSDFLQEVGTTFSSGQIITGLEFTQNVWLNTSLSRGYNIQGLFSAADGLSRRRWKDPIVVGNVVMSDTAHFISILADGGVFAHNVLLTTLAAKGGAPLGKFSGQGGFNVQVNGATPLLLRNVTNIAPVGGPFNSVDNILLGNDYATTALATAFTGATFEPANWTEFQTAYALKSGGPLDLAFGRGALGSGIGTWGARRDPSGWTYNPAFEQVNPSTLTTIAISEPQLPVYDANPFFSGQAAVSFTVTHDTTPGDALQYQIIDGDTAAVIQAWTDFTAAASPMTLTINRSPSFTPVKVMVRGKVNTAVTASQATKWRAGYIVAIMGQSLAIRPLTHNFALALTPAAEKMWVLHNSVNGSLASGPVLVNAGAVLGPRRMAEVVNAYGDGPVCLVDITEAGTGRDETSDANETPPNRSWAATMQAPVDYIRARGSDICIVLDHWFTNDANAWKNMARWCAPFYLRQQIDGLSSAVDGTGVQPYSGAAVQIVAGKYYTPVHFLFDLTGGGQGLFDAGRTRWVPWFGMSAYAASATLFEPGSDTTSSGNNAWAANDRQKGTVRWELEQMAEASPAYLPISLRSLPGWTGQASYGGHLAMPENTHVADTADGEGLVAPYMMIAYLRSLGKMLRAEPRIVSVAWSANGATAVVRVSLPGGGDLSTAYLQQQAGAYAGSFEGTNWIAPSVLPETSDPFLHNVQGFTIRRASNGLRYKTGFTAIITNTGTGAGAARYGEITITPTVAFANGDSIAFGLYDGFNTPTVSATNAARPHYHQPIETRAHVSGTGYGYPVVRESATLAFATASGINSSATAPAAFTAGQWTLADKATNGALTLTLTALPANGGAAITDVQYQIGAGNWISLGSTALAAYTISGLTNGVSASVKIRAVNSAGASAASDTKSATPTGDSTAPTLTTPTDAPNGSTGATGTVSTDDGSGTLYVVATTSATAPSAAQVKAGQDHLGAAASAATSKAVTTSGNQTVTLSGLSPSTTYYLHYMQEDLVPNPSLVVSGDGFITTAAATDATPLQSVTLMSEYNSTGKTGWTGSASITIGSSPNRALVLQFFGVDISGSASNTTTPTLTATFNGQPVDIFEYRYHPTDRSWMAYGYLPAPPSGAGTVALTTSTNQSSVCVQATEVDSAHQVTKPVSVGNSSATSGATITANGTTTQPGSLLMGGASMTRRSGLPSADLSVTGGTLLGVGHSGGATDLKTGYFASAYKLKPTAGADNVIFTLPESGVRWCWETIEVFRAP